MRAIALERIPARRPVPDPSPRRHLPPNPFRNGLRPIWPRALRRPARERPPDGGKATRTQHSPRVSAPSAKSVQAPSESHHRREGRLARGSLPQVDAKNTTATRSKLSRPSSRAPLTRRERTHVLPPGNEQTSHPSRCSRITWSWAGPLRGGGTRNRRDSLTHAAVVSRGTGSRRTVAWLPGERHFTSRPRPCSRAGASYPKTLSDLIGRLMAA